MQSSSNIWLIKPDTKQAKKSGIFKNYICGLDARYDENCHKKSWNQRVSYLYYYILGFINDMENLKLERMSAKWS